VVVGPAARIVVRGGTNVTVIAVENRQNCNFALFQKQKLMIDKANPRAGRHTLKSVFPQLSVISS
jgi:hypothetical protein